MDGTQTLPLLALDIGTYKVAGLVAAPEPGPEGDLLRVLAAAVRPQVPGAMRDGQIEDVEQVAETVARVLESLRQERGGPLPSKAAVAAAGRSLRIAPGSARRRLSATSRLDDGAVRALEMEALQEAAQAVERLPPAASGDEPPGPRAESYLCAGYSVVEYRLDGHPVRDPAGQRGHRLDVEVIGTFLPRRVLDALLAALEHVHLEPASLTLEPIAALEVAVPPTLRHLNLALVDVGAGTSDLALTRAGRVVAYGMVAEAGDRVTRHLAERYLLDVREAERLKRALGQPEGPLEATNVLGERLTLKREEGLDAVADVVLPLASRIAAECLRLNGGRPPDALLLVGGGSLTPGLPEALAEATGLAPGRVVRRDRHAVEGIPGAEAVLAGPEAITPLGIAVVAWRRKALVPLAVRVNGRPVLAFADGARAPVYDVLAAAGYGPRELWGRPGASLTVEVNGRLVTVPGEGGQAAFVRKNGAPAQLGDWVEAGDDLEVGPTRPGREAAATVADVGEIPAPLPLIVQGQPVHIPPEIRLDGRPAAPDDPVRDRSRLEVRLPRTAGEVLQHLGEWDGRSPLASPPLRVWVHETLHELRPPASRLWVNGAPAGPDHPVAPGDRIDYAPAGPDPEDRPPPTVRDLLERPDIAESLALGLPLTVNGQPVVLNLIAPAAVRRNGQPIPLDAPLHDGDRLELTRPPDLSPIVSDLFRQIDPRPPGSEPPRGPFWIRVNGQAAGFTTPLQAGDEVSWGWGPMGTASP